MANAELRGDAGFLPFVSVHALGKATFCERAGVLAHEQKEEEEHDEEAGTPRLDYLPEFEIGLIREALDVTRPQLRMTLIAAFVGAVVVWLAYLWAGGLLSILLGVVVLLLARKAFIHFQEWRELNRRIKQEGDAKASHLGDPGAGRRQINWWGLMKDKEFQAAPPVNTLNDPELRLGGKPVRIATYGGWRIPVILHHSELDEPKPYHLVRLAAHALILESGIRIGNPVVWGIILNPRTMMGMAVPVTEEMRKVAKETLRRFQRNLIEVENGTDPTPPPSRFCTNCPYGRPRVHRRGAEGVKGNGEGREPRLARGPGRLNYHSPCGDRFNWLPPHQDVEEKGLRDQ